MRNHRLEVTNTSSITSAMRLIGDLQPRQTPGSHTHYYNKKDCSSGITLNCESLQLKEDTTDTRYSW